MSPIGGRGGLRRGVKPAPEKKGFVMNRKNWLCLCFVMGMVLFLSVTICQAASLSFKVLDELTVENIITSGGSFLNKWDEGDQKWYYIEDCYVDRTICDCSFTELSSGTYFIQSYADGYLGEYYDNTTDFDAKTQIILEDDQDITLNDILLSRIADVLSFVDSISSDVPPEGAEIEIRGRLVNSTKKPIPLWQWIALSYGNITDSIFSALKQTPVLIPALGTVEVRQKLRVPAHAMEGWWKVTLLAGPTPSHWVSSTYWVNTRSFYKYVNEETMSLPDQRDRIVYRDPLPPKPGKGTAGK